MATFASTTVVDSYVCPYRDSPEASEESPFSGAGQHFNDQCSYAGSSGSSALHQDESDGHQETRTGFFEVIFGSPGGPSDDLTNHGEVAKTGPESGEGNIAQYWQNYDLSVSEAPKLFSDAEFNAVKRIREGLEVLVLRLRLQERVSARSREREVRAAVRVQAMARGNATRGSLPAIREQHKLRASVKREQKLFKRQLRSDGFIVYLYRNKDGALRKVTLKPNGKMNSLCWSTGVAMVKAGSVPLIALKSCYTGYPKRNFPTKSMQARATPLPDKSKSFTIQVDTGKVYVFVAAEEINGPSQKQLVRGIQSIIDEVSSPDSFYFDGTGVLRRVTSSIFDDRGNIAQREAMKKQRQERFRSRQEDAEARRAGLQQQGPADQSTEDQSRRPKDPTRQLIKSSTGGGNCLPSQAFDTTSALLQDVLLEDGEHGLAHRVVGGSNARDSANGNVRVPNQRRAAVVEATGSRDERDSVTTGKKGKLGIGPDGDGTKASPHSKFSADRLCVDIYGSEDGIQHSDVDAWIIGTANRSGKPERNTSHHSSLHGKKHTTGKATNAEVALTLRRPLWGRWRKDNTLAGSFGATEDLMRAPGDRSVPFDEC